jgi:hypothetical protein
VHRIQAADAWKSGWRTLIAGDFRTAVLLQLVISFRTSQGSPGGLPTWSKYFCDDPPIKHQSGRWSPRCSRFQFGKRINAKIVWLERGNYSAAVTAGLFFSLNPGNPAGNGWLDVRFHTGPRDVLLAVFLHLWDSARICANLRPLGRRLGDLCWRCAGARVQNFVGLLVAKAYGEVRRWVCF